MRRVYTIRKLIEVMISLMAPEAADELRELLENSYAPAKKREALETKFQSILEGVARQYEKMDNRRDRELVIASVALSIPYRDLAYHVNGLSEWKYHRAKKFALMNSVPVQKTLKREKYSPEKVNHFLTFVTR